MVLPNIASTSKRNISRNKRSYNSLTKQGIIIPRKKKQLLNNTVKPKTSLDSENRIVCKRLEVLLYLCNAGKKKVKH